MAGRGPGKLFEHVRSVGQDPDNGNDLLVARDTQLVQHAHSLQNGAATPRVDKRGKGNRLTSVSPNVVPLNFSDKSCKMPLITVERYEESKKSRWVLQFQ